MSGPTSIGRVLRTLSHLRVTQAAAQLRHLLAPQARRPAAFAGPPPPLALSRPARPFLPPARHAGCWRAGETTTFRALNREVSFQGGVDWDFEGEGPLFAYHLHHGEALRSSALSPADRSALILDWLDAHRAGVGWDSHPTAHRVLAFGKLLLSPGELALADADEARLRGSLASQIETLCRDPEVRLQANHLFTNLLAVVFGGLLFDGEASRRWLARSDAFRAEMQDQIHADGCHQERSPMYHAILLEQTLDLLNLVRARPERAPAGLADELAAAAARMCGALEILTHPDGEIALFSDAAFGVAQPLARLVDYAASLGVPAQPPAVPGRLTQGGFVRLRDGELHLIASVAGPSPEHQPGHAHCDALSFELSVSGRRVVTDTGVFEYVPGPRRDLARATRSHATIEVAGCEQAEMWSAHRVGGRPRVRVLEHMPERSCEVICTAWAPGEVSHRRRFELESGALVIRDEILGPPSAVHLTLPLAPGLRARLVAGDGAPQLCVRVAPRVRLRVDLPEGPAWALEPGDYFPEFGCSERRWLLVGDSDAFASGVWRFALERV